MSRTRLLAAVAALGCAGVVPTGCSTTKAKVARQPATPIVTASSEQQGVQTATADTSTLGPATKSPKPAPSASKPAATSASPTSASPTSASPTPAIAAGRVFVFVKSVDVAARVLTYDQAQFLTGDAANKAAAEDKQEVPVPNDYYIRNVNTRLRTAPVTVDATLLGSIALTQQVNLSPVTLDAIAKLAASEEGALVGFWITVDGKGRITKVEEQYVP